MSSGFFISCICKSDEKETDAVDDIKADSLLVTEEPIFEVGEIYTQDTSKHQIEEIIEIQPAEKVEKSEEEQLFTLTQEETVFTLFVRFSVIICYISLVIIGSIMYFMRRTFIHTLHLFCFNTRRHL
jgi:hypothetical protein